jgi:hypothetical protein
MENLTIRQLKDKLPVKFKYAERVVERAKGNGVYMNTKDVYNAVSGRSGIHKATICRILELLIEESEHQLASIA